MLEKKSKYTLAIIGATGAVGLESLKILAERDFPVEALHLYASMRSAGERLPFKDDEILVQDLATADLSGVDLVFVSATEEVSRTWCPRAAQAGAVAIDDSSVFRMDPDVPLVVPEVNPEALQHMPKGIVAIPNCTTTPLVMVLKPLHQAARLRRVVVTTFQSVSGTGKRAMDELMDQTRAILNFQDVTHEVYPHRIAFNCLPHIGSFNAEGYCSEEVKIVRETRKILGDDSVQLAPTTVRVPVFRCHAESVNVELEEPLQPDEARALLAEMPGVVVYDDPERELYPMPMDAAGQDGVYVGRVRKDETVPCGLNLWVVSDNLRKGAALNAVQIAERLIGG